MKKLTFIKCLIIVLNIIVPMVSIIAYVCGKILIIPSLQWEFSMDSVIVVLLEVILIALGKYYDREVENTILGRRKQEILKEINPPTKNELEKARDEMREGLKILMIVSVMCIICGFFAGWIKINIAVAIGMCMVIAFIYADYLPHAKRYAREYDAYFIGNEKADSIRGLARIYYQEYFQSRLKRGAKFYKDIEQEKIYVDGKDDPQEAKDYCSCVLSIRSAMINQTLEIVMWLMLTLAVITIKDDVYNVFFTPITNENVRLFLQDIIKLSASVLFMAISICQIYECDDECLLIKRIWTVLRGNDLEKLVEECENVIAGPRGKLCKARGSFVYSQKYIEEKHDISSSPLKYRMKFPDRYMTHKVRYVYTYLLLFLIGILLMLEIEYAPAVVWIIYLMVTIVGFPVGMIVFLPEVNRRKIRKKCIELGKGR